MYRRVLNMSSIRIQHRSSSPRSVSDALPRHACIMSSTNRKLKLSTMATSDDEKWTVKTVPRPWPSAVVESHGDYRAEAFLESHIGGPLYQHQSSLPRLPIPSLDDTMERFLPTALPLAKTEQERATLLDACAKFPEQARVLQERLQQRASDMSDSSWLQHWWNTAGYLQVRDPVVINVSYFFHFRDDPTLPPYATNTISSDNNNTKPPNVTRGAAILTALAQFRQQVVTGSRPTDTIGRASTPLCSAAYKYMFHACRIPHVSQDSYKLFDPSRHSHCIVARQGQFFAVDFIDPTTQLPFPLHVLEERLMKCLQRADGDARRPMELGWLTSMDRDSWAKAREEMIRVGGDEMKEALELLESGAFMLNLDNEQPVSRKQCGELFLHGNITSGHNRWFDKSVQILCTDNGKAGLCGEHSMMDGMPIVNLADHLTATTYHKATKAQTASAPTDSTDGVRNIFARVYTAMEASSVPSLVRQAEDHLTKLVLDHELDVQSFHGYGSTFIKKAGFSPDAYVQIAMQLATYRLFGEQVGTYEATQVRPFLHGRTETTRTVSPASEAFLKRMGLVPRYDEHDDQIRREKLDLLRDAVVSHVAYIGKAAKGLGVDRHLFGLSMLVADGEQAPELYEHPAFARSKRWRVSTSHLTHPQFDSWGYGEVVPDGVGLSYAIKADSCVFNVTALRSQQWTDRLCHLLEEVLMEMRGMVELEHSPSSRL